MNALINAAILVRNCLVRCQLPRIMNQAVSVGSEYCVLLLHRDAFAFLRRGDVPWSLLAQHQQQHNNNSIALRLLSGSGTYRGSIERQQMQKQFVTAQ